MKFWAEKGIDGFRLDAFQFAAKDTNFPVFPAGYEKNFIQYYAMGEHLHDYLREMNAEVFSKYDVMSVAEGAGKSFQDAHDLVDADRKELNMAYAFDAVDIAKPEGYSLLHFKEVFSRWDSAFAQNGWLSIFLANHDQARLVSRFGNDTPAFRDLSAKMLATFILTMRGTPYFYYGDELAMTNAGFERIEEFKDIPTLNEYQYQKNRGGDLKKFMEQIKFGCRDNGRTPFQWNATRNAGFTTGKPWIKTNPNYKVINAQAQEKNPNSTLNYFRSLVKLRKKNLTLVYGKYELLDKNNPSVYAYTREDENGKLLILLNFTKENAIADIGMDISKKTVLLSNYKERSRPGKQKNTVLLKPYEAKIYALK